jgi:hypothetical protein
VGAKKWRYSVTLGYQTIDVATTGDLKVYSMFEYAAESHKGPPKEKAFVSNSLQVRQDWMQRYGGTGTVPSQLIAKPTRKKQEVVAMMIAHDDLPPHFWEQLQKFLPGLA